MGSALVPHIKFAVFIPSGVENADSEFGVMPHFTDGTEGLTSRDGFLVLWYFGLSMQ